MCAFWSVYTLVQVPRRNICSHNASSGSYLHVLLHVCDIDCFVSPRSESPPLHTFLYTRPDSLLRTSRQISPHQSTSCGGFGRKFGWPTYQGWVPCGRWRRRRRPSACRPRCAEDREACAVGGPQKTPKTLRPHYPGSLSPRAFIG